MAIRDFGTTVYINLEDVVIGAEKKAFKSLDKDRYNGREIIPGKEGLIVLAPNGERLSHGFKVAEYFKLKYEVIASRSRYSTYTFALKLGVPVEGPENSEPFVKPVEIKAQKPVVFTNFGDCKGLKNPVLCVETGIVYYNCAEAAKAINKPNGRGNIANCCKKEDGTAFGYHGKYYQEEK